MVLVVIQGGCETFSDMVSVGSSSQQRRACKGLMNSTIDGARARDG